MALVPLKHRADVRAAWRARGVSEEIALRDINETYEAFGDLSERVRCALARYARAVGPISRDDIADTPDGAIMGIEMLGYRALVEIRRSIPYAPATQPCQTCGGTGRVRRSDLNGTHDG